MVQGTSTVDSVVASAATLDAFDEISKSTLESLNTLNTEITGKMTSITVKESLKLLGNMRDVKLFLKTKDASAYTVCVQRVLNDLMFDRVQVSSKLSERLKQDGKWGRKTKAVVLLFQKHCNSVLKYLGVKYLMKEDGLIGSEVINAMLSFESGRPLEFLMLKLGMSKEGVDALFAKYSKVFMDVFSSGSLGLVSDWLASIGDLQGSSDGDLQGSSESVLVGADVAKEAVVESEDESKSVPTAWKQKVRAVIKTTQGPSTQAGAARQPEVMTVAKLLKRVKDLANTKQVEVNGRVYTVSQIKRLQDSDQLGKPKGLWSRIAFDYGLEFKQEFEDTDRDTRYKFQKMVERYPRLTPYYEYLGRIIQEESQWRPKLKSGSGKAYGLAQIKQSYYQYYLHNIKRLNQDKRKVALDKMDKLLRPRYNLKVFLSVINRQAQWMLGLDYVKQYPDRIGFVLYIIHHDGFGGSKWTLKYLQEAESVNAKTFGAFKKKYRDELPKSWHANFGVLKAVLNKAAIVNGADMETMFAPESVTDEYMKSKVQFFGDSLAAGVQGCLYGPGAGPVLDITKSGWTSTRLRESFADLLQYAGREYGVIFMGHNDMLMKSKSDYQSRERQVVENMRSVIASMKEAGMKPIIILPQEFAKVEETRYGSIDPENIAKLVVKLEAEFGSELMIKTVKSSKLHLSARGYQAVLQQVRSKIYNDRFESL